MAAILPHASAITITVTFDFTVEVRWICGHGTVHPKSFTHQPTMSTMTPPIQELKQKYVSILKQKTLKLKA
jgi:hypothetical protein